MADRNSIKTGDIVQHFKGGEYKYEGIATNCKDGGTTHCPGVDDYLGVVYHSETQEAIPVFRQVHRKPSEEFYFMSVGEHGRELVIYESLKEHKMYARPVESFFSDVTLERFKVTRIVKGAE